MESSHSGMQSHVQRKAALGGRIAKGPTTLNAADRVAFLRVLRSPSLLGKGIKRNGDGTRAVRCDAPACGACLCLSRLCHFSRAPRRPEAPVSSPGKHPVTIVVSKA